MAGPKALKHEMAWNVMFRLAEQYDAANSNLQTCYMAAARNYRQKHGNLAIPSLYITDTI